MKCNKYIKIINLNKLKLINYVHLNFSFFFIKIKFNYKKIFKNKYKNKKN